LTFVGNKEMNERMNALS